MQKASESPNLKKPWPYTTLWSIFLGQMKFNRDNPIVLNILRVWKMSLKPFRDTKIRITIVRCKKRAWLPTGRNGDYTTFWSIFFCQTEFNRDNPGICNILRAREKSFKPFRDEKFVLLSSDAKSECDSQLEETMTIRLFDQFSCVKRNLIGTTPAFLIF
jgi:hypothetical protein